MKNDLLLQEFIQLSLLESTRADREKIELPNELVQIEKYVDNGCFLHFGKFNKLGINPQSHYATPIGIYAYPLTKGIYNQLENNTIPFAGGFQFIHIFKPISNANVITLQDLTFYDTKNIIGELINLYPIFKRQAIAQFDYFIRHESDMKSVANWLWDFIKELINSPLQKTKVFRQLGIDGIIDMGEGIIHENEPTQAVFFSKDKIEQLDVFWNPIYQRQRNIVIKGVRNKLKPSYLEQMKKVFDLVQKLQSDGLSYYEIIDDKEQYFENTKIDNQYPEDSIIYGAFYATNYDFFRKNTDINHEELKQKLRMPVFKE